MTVLDATHKLFEYFANIEPEYMTYPDVITDMILGLIGGLLAMCFVRKPAD